MVAAITKKAIRTEMKTGLRFLRGGPDCEKRVALCCTVFFLAGTRNLGLGFALVGGLEATGA